jgi:hypothetical protein
MAIGTVNWTGLSGQTYEFSVYELAVHFKPLPAVYVLAKLGHGSRFEALYVGEAESLEDRLNTCRAQHDGFQRALKMGVTHICARLVSNGAAERLRIETDLRHALNPPCNAQPAPRGLGDIFAGR